MRVVCVTCVSHEGVLHEPGAPLDLTGDALERLTSLGAVVAVAEALPVETPAAVAAEPSPDVAASAPPTSAEEPTTEQPLPKRRRSH